MTGKDIILRFLATHRDELVREFCLKEIGLFGSFA